MIVPAGIAPPARSVPRYLAAAQRATGDRRRTGLRHCDVAGTGTRGTSGTRVTSAA